MSLYLMSVYSITRSQLCWDWVLDYVSMRLLSLTQFIWRPSVLQLCCSGTHRINTCSNVTVPDVSVFHHKESIVFQLGAWLCKHENCSPPHNSFGDHPSPVSSSGTHRIIHVGMSLYLMSVYSIPRSQLCWDWVLDYVSMRLLSLIQFIWRPSVLQLCCSGTHRINTRSNVTVPDVSVFHHKKSIVLRLGAWLCKHETALPTQFIWRPSVPQFSSSGTHRINTCRNVTVPDVSVFHHRSQLCWDWVLDYVSMRLLSPTIHLETICPPVVLLWHSQKSIHVVMSLYLMWVYSITRSQLCEIGCLIM